MSESDLDTSRAVVRTYVPAYQRDAWDDHAEELDMSRSEFVKAMVQAGREAFGATVESDASEETTESTAEQPSAPATDEDPLKDRVLAILGEQGCCTWDEMVAALTEDMEERLESTLESLQNDNHVRYSGRKGGYTITDE